VSAQRHRGLSEQAAETAIDQACRMLRLPTIRGQFPDLAEAAKRDQMSYKGFLAELLLAECDDRARRRSERRIKAAAFPREKSAEGLRLRCEPQCRRRHGQHPRDLRVGQEGAASLPDRRLRYRQITPADRPGY
jgi:DNA replication protein DnaC